MEDTFKFVCTNGELVVSKKNFDDIGGLFPLLKDGKYIKVDYTVNQMKEVWFIICSSFIFPDGSIVKTSTELNISYSLYPIFDLLEMKELTNWLNYMNTRYEYVGVCRWLLHDHDDMPDKLVMNIRSGLQERIRDNLATAMEILEDDGIGPELVIQYYIATGICNTYELVEEVIEFYTYKYGDGVEKLVTERLNFPADARNTDTFDVDEFIVGGVDQYYDEFFKL